MGSLYAQQMETQKNRGFIAAAGMVPNGFNRSTAGLYAGYYTQQSKWQQNFNLGIYFLDFGNTHIFDNQNFTPLPNGTYKGVQINPSYEAVYHIIHGEKFKLGLTAFAGVSFGSDKQEPTKREDIIAVDPNDPVLQGNLGSSRRNYMYTPVGLDLRPTFQVNPKLAVFAQVNLVQGYFLYQINSNHHKSFHGFLLDNRRASLGVQYRLK